MNDKVGPASRAGNDFTIRDRLDSSPHMVMMMGIPRTGKSRWANGYARSCGLTVMGGDDIRRAFGVEFKREIEPWVHLIKQVAVKAILLRGQSIIVDETNITKERRAAWIELALECGCSCVRVVEILRPRDRQYWADRCAIDNFSWDFIESFEKRYEPFTQAEAPGDFEVSHESYPSCLEREPPQ